MIFARHWIQTKDRVRSAFLKPVPGGNIFRAPNPKVFGATEHYLVNDGDHGSPSGAAPLGVVPQRFSACG